MMNIVCGDLVLPLWDFRSIGADGLFLACTDAELLEHWASALVAREVADFIGRKGTGANLRQI